MQKTLFWYSKIVPSLYYPDLLAKTLCMHSSAAEAELALHNRAFDLVSSRFDWKNEINTFVTMQHLRAEEVTIEQIVEAVAFFTATKATIRYADNRMAGEGYFVSADGYRLGPAGDH